MPSALINDVHLLFHKIDFLVKKIIKRKYGYMPTVVEDLQKLLKKQYGE